MKMRVIVVSIRGNASVMWMCIALSQEQKTNLYEKVWVNAGDRGVLLQVTV